MLFSQHKELPDLLVEMLMRGPQTVTELHRILGRSGWNGTERAVYKSVSQLIGAGVLVKVGKMVRLDQEWVRGVRGRFAERKLLEVAPGEKATYLFTSIEHLDTFWKSVAFELEDKEKDGQVLFYNPHNFWAYVPARKESEDAYYRHFEEQSIHAFFTVGGESGADKAFKRAYQNEYLQIDTRNVLSIPRTDHVTIYSNYVITVRLSRAFAAKVDRMYDEHSSIQEFLPQLLNLPSRARFTIENNPAKAAKLRKTLSLNFYFRTL